MELTYAAEWQPIAGGNRLAIGPYRALAFADGGWQVTCSAGVVGGTPGDEDTLVPLTESAMAAAEAAIRTHAAERHGVVTVVVAATRI